MLADVVLVTCVLLIAVGAGLIYLPAGLIVGGALGLAGVIRNEMGAASDRAEHRPGA